MVHFDRAGYAVSQSTHASDWFFRQSLIGGTDNFSEQIAFNNYNVSDKSRIHVYLLKGFTDNSLDLGMGATLNWSYEPKIDFRTQLCHTALMSHLTRKFIAVIMLLWLPVFTGSALAASVSMQLSQGGCHESAASQSMSHAGMDMDMGEHHMHHGDKPLPADGHSPSNSVCGVCHLACTAYLAVPIVSIAAAPSAAGEITPYLVVFNSVTSVPLLPPPLVRI